MAVATKQKLKKNTPASKKRHGAHQKRSQHFAKAYWPYIPLLAIVGVGLFFNSLLSHSEVLSYATNTTPGGLLAETNVERQENTLSSLKINTQLNEAAQAKANDMVARDYWAHVTPDGKEPWAFINTTGYSYTAAGENLAYGFATSDETVQGWMNSAGHRANILNNEYSEVGFGIANSKNYQHTGSETIIVAIYAKPSATTSQAQPHALPQNQQPIATVRNDTGAFSVGATAPGQVKIARIQLVSSSAAPWSSLAFVAIAAILSSLFLYRHSKAWHKALKKGEKFIIHHKALDILIVSGVMMAIILLGTGGVIR